MNDSIRKVWFDNGSIFILTDKGEQKSQPLEAFPPLFTATAPQREKYYIWDEGRSIRWEELDEDIHITNFIEKETVNYDNEVNNLLSRIPCLDMKAFAEYIGMHWTKLARFRYGVWKPNAETMDKIKNGIAAIGKEMTAAVV